MKWLNSVLLEQRGKKLLWTVTAGACDASPDPRAAARKQGTAGPSPGARNKIEPEAKISFSCRVLSELIFCHRAKTKDYLGPLRTISKTGVYMESANDQTSMLIETA